MSAFDLRMNGRPDTWHFVTCFKLRVLGQLNGFVKLLLELGGRVRHLQLLELARLELRRVEDFDQSFVHKREEDGVAHEEDLVDLVL